MHDSKRILMIVTSHGAIDESHPTGVWFEEFSIPYEVFRGAGYVVDVVSPQGGAAPVDPRSLEDERVREQYPEAFAALSQTRRLDDSVTSDDYAAIFFPGGHGTMFDLPDNPQVQRVVSEFAQADKVLASVCHGPACLVGAMLRDGSALVKGRRVTSFTDSEERAVELDTHMPFLLETRLRELGAEFVPASDWADNVVVDGKLVTGQNPQSSGTAAQAVLRLLGAPGAAT